MLSELAETLCSLNLSMDERIEAGQMRFEFAKPWDA